MATFKSIVSKFRKDLNNAYRTRKSVLDVTDEYLKQLEDAEFDGGSIVSVTADQTSGKKIGSISVDGNATNLYSPGVSYIINLPTSGYTEETVTIQGVSRSLYSITIDEDSDSDPLSDFHTGMHEDYAINISGTESDFSKLFAHEIGEGEVTFYFTSAPSTAFNVLIREAI